MSTDSVCVNEKWEGKDASYNLLVMDSGQRCYSAVVRRAIGIKRLRRRYQGLCTLAEVERTRKARRVMWGKALESLLPYLVALLLACGGFWLLRGHDEGADRAAGRIEQVDSLRIRGGVR